MSPTQGPLDGYGVLVTGGGSGIGLAAANRLAADGATVTICGRSDARLRAAAEGTALRWCVCDVTDEDQVEAAVDAATQAAGRLDVAVACAGGSEHLGPLVLADVGAFRRTVDLNVTGTFLTLKHAAPRMVRGGGGSFVGVSSIAATLTHRYLGAYCVGKAGIEMLVRVAADELGPSHVRVNCVRPGLIDTDMQKDTGLPDRVGKYKGSVPMQRGGTAEEVAEAILWLCAEQSSYCTGQFIDVAGGRGL